MSSSNDTNNDLPPLPDIAAHSRRWSETYQEKALRKINENPWVPLGALVTTGTLVMATVRLRQGNSVKFQHWLRARVAVQALTIVAILGGLYKYGQANLEENQRIMEQRNQKLMEKKMEQERADLERRIQAAEVAHKEDELVKGMTSGALSSSSPGTLSSSPSRPTTTSSLSDKSTSGSSWWRYLGWSDKSSSNSSAEKSSKET